LEFWLEWLLALFTNWWLLLRVLDLLFIKLVEVLPLIKWFVDGELEEFELEVVDKGFKLDWFSKDRLVESFRLEKSKVLSDGSVKLNELPFMDPNDSFIPFSGIMFSLEKLVNDCLCMLALDNSDDVVVLAGLAAVWWFINWLKLVTLGDTFVLYSSSFRSSK
jgi:hypothetical protein